MEQFNLEVKTANLISDFDKACSNGTISILEWFYKAINYKGIFESDFADVMHSKLTLLGYKEVTSPAEELEGFKSLMQKGGYDDSEKVGSTIISLILKCLNEKSPLSQVLEQFISIYNQTFNKEHTFDGMMNALKGAIGSEVTFVLIKEGKIELQTGTLDEVDDYRSVTISGVNYPFIGHNTAINKITTSEVSVLFNNSLSKTTDNLSGEDIIEKKNIELFGNKYTKELKKVC